ncbi:MAG: hypothetical protein Q8908_11120 [Bacteroidota bacterium]|nr:hypothetical protein [Bacteroidota bacterium]
METNHLDTDTFDEDQSLQVIHEMIQVSRKRLKYDGVFFIIWGWVNFITFFLEYLSNVVVHTYQMTLIKRDINIILPVMGVILTVFYIYRKNRKTTTYIGRLLRYVWISLFFSLVLVNLIQFNVLHKLVFELQNPVFMVFFAFAIVVTGGFLKYKMIVAGGIIFALLAYISSYLALPEQLLMESIAWLVAFIIPGHILYSQRKS